MKALHRVCVYFNRLKLLIIQLISKFYPLDARDAFMLSNWSVSQLTSAMSVYCNDYKCTVQSSNWDTHYTINSIYPQQNTRYLISDIVQISSFELQFELPTHDIRVSFNVNSWYLLCPNKMYKYLCDGKETCILHLLIFAIYQEFKFNPDTKKFVEYSLNGKL